ncbi:ergothioneine biosynthesis protein EgtB [Candidimonas sp. SYP-B2681]|uniref:ergothioneine biosynthesis protein EgtB n=1 Tax=Candidimonas sp. SYP-B2681 TaxID=2497686 RepID=UPI000F89C67B|nr:ergothioneine biosynthesis protein EgtB [Candidimonas sp. SYP-B2681]RTZ48001.1 ergothioneine biosynthesis protein EgtB [Candidimonas sp. SYP-B2681]
MTANLQSALDIGWNDASRQILLHQYGEVRAHSLERAAPLSAEDQCVQSMPDVSPTKWHLAHTTWFFEAMLLRPFLPAYQPFDEHYFYLFNSYYEALGPRHPRPQRGLLTRPSLDDIHEYRAYVDAAMRVLIENCDEKQWHQIFSLGQLGLHHEQQHQELMLTDILHVLWCNPLHPAYQTGDIAHLLIPARASAAPAIKWQQYPGGVILIGHDAQALDEFAFDNETPRHEVLLRPYQLADRLVTCGEFAEFIEDGGYRRPSLWLSDGWAAVQSQGLQSPEYWIEDEGPGASPHWQVFGLHGLQAMVPSAPVTNISFYEAAAYAEWAGARLPTEFEWENSATDMRMRQMAGYAWQWTRSSYDPYPGFRPSAGAVGEYNGKFMVGQLVLRGSSYATPAGHTRPSYRNFFPPNARWQFSGLRLASDLK